VALCDVLDQLTKARGPIGQQEIESSLRPGSSLALGEASERLSVTPKAIQDLLDELEASKQRCFC
jgi:hypothetical protein